MRKEPDSLSLSLSLAIATISKTMETLKILRIVETVVHFLAVSPRREEPLLKVSKSQDRGAGDSPRRPVSRSSVKKTKIATSEKTPVHKSAANGTGTRAKKRFRQGERPTLLSRILLPAPEP